MGRSGDYVDGFSRRLRKTIEKGRETNHVIVGAISRDAYICHCLNTMVGTWYKGELAKHGVLFHPNSSDRRHEQQATFSRNLISLL